MHALSKRFVPVVMLSVMACHDEASAIVPDTPRGRVDRAWIAAHNRDEGHAVVHFTATNRGTGPLSGAQMDSVVYSSVRFADSVGTLVVTRVNVSGDTLLDVALADRRGGTWTAQFRPVPQPAPFKVDVRIARLPVRATSKLVDGQR